MRSNSIDMKLRSNSIDRKNESRRGLGDARAQQGSTEVTHFKMMVTMMISIMMVKSTRMMMMGGLRGALRR